MKKNITIGFLLCLNVFFGSMLLDQGISLAYCESSTSFMHRRAQGLMDDISKLFLCFNAGELINDFDKVKFKSVKIYMEGGSITGVGYKGEPSPIYDNCLSGNEVDKVSMLIQVE